MPVPPRLRDGGDRARVEGSVRPTGARSFSVVSFTLRRREHRRARVRGGRAECEVVHNVAGDAPERCK